MKWLLNLLGKFFPFLMRKQSNNTKPFNETKPGQNPAGVSTPIDKPESKVSKNDDDMQPDAGAPQKKDAEIVEPVVKEPLGNNPRTTKNEFSVDTGQRTPRRIEVSKRPFNVSVTGEIDETLFSNKKRVGYYPTQKFHQGNPKYFPLVMMPNNNTVIKPPVNGKTFNKGMTEESFCRVFLMKYFKGKIFDSLTVFHGYSPTEPDLSFVDLASGKNIFIDIEIDEPYDGVNRTPTHYLDSTGIKTSDHNRNLGFTERGWMVIRFAEEQIVKTPNACCKYIGEVIKSVFSGFQSDCLNINEDLTKIKIWTEQEARQMARDNYREKYLEITEFFRSDTPRNYQINDSSLGESIEEDLKRKKTGTKPSEGKTTASTGYKPENTNLGGSKTLPPIIVNEDSKKDEPRVSTKSDLPSKSTPQTYGRE